MAAAQSLGWESIDSYIMNGDALHAELAEIDENLIRSELTATQYAEHMARRKQIWEELKETGGTSCPGSLSDGRKAGPQHDEGFAESTAQATGESKRSTNRATSRAGKVCQEARDIIRGTKADTGKFLDELLKVPDEDPEGSAPEYSTQCISRQKAVHEVPSNTTGNTTENTTVRSAPQSAAPKKRKANGYPDDFESFWSAYPDRDGATQYAEHMARRKQIWEELQDSSGTTCSTAGGGAPGDNEGFAESTANATGKSKQDTNRATRRAGKVCQEARDIIRGTKADMGFLCLPVVIPPGRLALRNNGDTILLRNNPRTNHHGIKQRRTAGTMERSAEGQPAVT